MKQNIDYGTVELQQKRALNITKEPLDLYLEKDLITEEEHSAGLWLRWLYTLRYGPSTIAAYDPSQLPGFAIPKHRNKKWLKIMQRWYKYLTSELKRIQADKIVLDVCIYQTPIDHYDLYKFKEGMELLVRRSRKRII